MIRRTLAFKNPQEEGLRRNIDNLSVQQQRETDRYNSELKRIDLERQGEVQELKQQLQLFREQMAELSKTASPEAAKALEGAAGDLARATAQATTDEIVALQGEMTRLKQECLEKLTLTGHYAFDEKFTEPNFDDVITQLEKLLESI
jgi:HAMP domain-containing protein